MRPRAPKVGEPIEVPVLVPETGRWYDFEVDLSRFSGQKVTVDFIEPKPTRIAWSQPRVYPGPRSESEEVAARSVLYVVVDALRADALGCYGAPEGLTPAIDRLARRAELYQEARATASWTLPSVASLMTGKHPGQVGALRVPPRLDPDTTTLAEVCEQHGVRAWGISANTLLGVASRMTRGFTRFHVHRSPRTPAVEVTEKALGFIADANGHPLILYVHYMDPHGPYRLDDSSSINTSDLRRAEFRGEPIVMLAEQVGRLRGGYQSDVADLDAGLHALLRTCEAQGWAIVLTSDHGEEFFEHGSFSHGQTLFEEVLRVPLLVAAPDRPSAFVTRPVTLEAVPASVASLAGISFPERDLWSQDEDESRIGLAELGAAPRCENWPRIRLRSAWRGHYKAVRNYEQGCIVTYDLSVDPTEARPTAIPPEVQAELEDRLSKWPKQAADRDKAAKADLEKALRELGYLR